MSMVTQDELNRSFVESGEKDRLQELLKRRLEETGWVAEVKKASTAIVNQKGIENLTCEELINEVTPAARKAVPEAVKRELLQLIRSFLQQQSGISDL